MDHSVTVVMFSSRLADVDSVIKAV